MRLAKRLQKGKDIWTNHKWKIVGGLIFEAILCLAACWVANPVWFSKSNLTIFSATAGGEWEKLGGTLAKALKQKKVGGNVTVKASAGSLDNINALKNGSAQLAFIAELPSNDQEGKLPDASAIKQVLRLPPSYLHIVCLSAKFGKTPIMTEVVEKLKNDFKKNKAKIYLGKRNSGTRQLAEVILTYYGVVNSDFKDVGEESSFSEAAEALRSSKLDIAFFLVGTHAHALEQLAKKSDSEHISFVEIDRADGLATHHTELYAFLMPKHVFSGFGTLPTRNIKTLRCGQILAASSDLPAYIVKRITEVAYETGDYQSPFMTGAAATERHRGYPCHPGALAFEQRELFGGVRGTILGTIITIMFAPLGLMISATLGKWPAKNYHKYVEQINERLRELKQDFPGALEKFRSNLSAILKECLQEYTAGRLSRDGYLRVREYAAAFDPEEERRLMEHKRIIDNKVTFSSLKKTLHQNSTTTAGIGDSDHFPSASL